MRTKNYTTAELREIAASAAENPDLPREIVALAKDWLGLHPEPAELPDLTDRQSEIFEYFRQVQAKQGTSPTIREIGAQFGINSPNGVVSHLRALARKGVLVKNDGPRTARCMRIAEAYRN